VAIPPDPRRLIRALAAEAVNDPAAAMGRCQQILQRAPTSLPVLCIAAGIQRRSGKFAEAAELLARAAAVDAEASPVFAERAALAMCCQDFELAAQSLRALLQKHPGQSDSWFNLGLAEEQLGRVQAAIEGFENALSLAPDGYPAASARLAMLLATVGRDADARQCVDQALAADPDHVETRYALGMLLLAEGKTEQALGEFRHCVARQPGLAGAWQQLLECRRIEDPGDPELAAARALLDQPDVSQVEREQLAMAVGKALDDLHQYAAAFDCFHRAKKSRRKRLPQFDREAWRAATDARIAAPAPGSPFAPEATIRPVFIVGMPRSGTTLVDQILTAHPQAGGVGELAFFDQAAERFFAAGLEPEAGAALRADYLRVLAATRATVVTNKYPANFRNMPLLRWLMPEARFVHLRRSALDTCLSVYLQDFPLGNLYANDLEDIAAYYGDYRRLMTHWAGPKDDVLELTYETLLNDQAGVTRQLLDFCGLDWDAACLDFASNPRPVGTLSRWQVRQPVYASSVGRWRHYAAQLEPLIRALGPWADSA